LWFNAGVKILLSIAPTVNSIDGLKSEDEELQFIKAFRNLMRILNVLTSFSQFAFSHLDLEEQQFEDYKSKYLDLFDKARSQKEGENKASIIHDIDFELELIQRDEINVAYILRLLAELKADEESEDHTVRRDANNRRKSILDMLGAETQLRSKRELIERFINEQMPRIQAAEEVVSEFNIFWAQERDKSLVKLCESEGLNQEAVMKAISDYHFSGRAPLREQIVAALEVKPKILERKSIIERVTRQLMEIVHTFDEGIGGIGN
jgi:type I restriction enzyme R subunit